MVLKEDLYQRAVARFKGLVKNKAQKEQLCQVITYDSFKENIVSENSEK